MKGYAKEGAGMGVAVAIFLVIVIGAMAFLSLGGLALMPWRVEFERRVYEESRSHVDGTNLSISRMYLDWSAAEGAQKNVIRGMICTEADQIDRNDLTPANSGYVSELCGY